MALIRAVIISAKFASYPTAVVLVYSSPPQPYLPKYNCIQPTNLV